MGNRLAGRGRVGVFAGTSHNSYFDAAGRRTSTTDANGNVEAKLYSATGQLLKLRWPRAGLKLNFQDLAAVADAAAAGEQRFAAGRKAADEVEKLVAVVFRERFQIVENQQGSLGGQGREDAAGVVAVVQILLVQDRAQLQQRADETAKLVAGHAPITLEVTKEAVRRIRRTLTRDEGEDLILRAYMSEDFREGMDAFLNKRTPNWKGK